MMRAFEIRFGVLFFLFFALARAASAATPSSQQEFCQNHDDSAETAEVDRYFLAQMKEHQRFGFSQPIGNWARVQAKAFFEQRILDKRAEICAERLKIVEEIKSAPSKWNNANCASAVVVGLLDQYMNKIAGAFDENRRLLTSLRDKHVQQLMLKLFEVARGSPSVADSTLGGIPGTSASKETRFEWVKQEASKLGAEAQSAWGALNPEKNPIIQTNLALAREAVRARQERDAAKARYRTDGRLPPGCRAR